MQEAYGIKNKDLLWAATVFRGGIAGNQQAPCGAVSASALALGFRHRRSTAIRKKLKKRGKLPTKMQTNWLKALRKSSVPLPVSVC